jgi:SRSO17 transposase
VFLAYGSARGRALVDRELYLPTSWTENRDRCAAAGVPAEVGFATKPQLALDMLVRAHDAGVLSGWVTADEAFGQNRTFRGWLAARAVPFVLATRSDDTLTCPDGRRHQAKHLVTLVGDRAWERRSAGPGAHGERLYDWTVLTLHATARPTGSPPGGVTGCWSDGRSTRSRARTLSWRSIAAPAPQRRRCPS